MTDQPTPSVPLPASEVALLREGDWPDTPLSEALRVHFMTEYGVTSDEACEATYEILDIIQKTAPSISTKPRDGASEAVHIGRNITFSPYDNETGNAVVSPEEPDGPYWTLIAQGGEHEQNAIALEIVRRLSATPPAEADKLRVAVEAYLTSVDASDDLGHGPADLMEACLQREDAALLNLRQALAALKAVQS